jgi:hypothetical protein
LFAAGDSKVEIDSNVQNFQPSPSNDTKYVYVLGTNGNLWLENSPWGTVPPARVQVDGSVFAFQPMSNTEAVVLGTDGNLWLELGPWGTVPPERIQIDANVML